jgi:AraC-like DNA-binding protein
MLLCKSVESSEMANIQPLTVMLLERLDDAAFLVDLQGRFIYGNPAARKLLDCSAEELLAMMVSDLPLTSLLQFWSDRNSNPNPGSILCFADRYISPSLDELAVEVTVSYDREIEQKCSCLLIHQVDPNLVKPFQDLTLPRIPKLEKVFKFIEENYARSISLRDVALEMGYCPSYLTDLVRRCSGKSVNYWIIKCRITLACRLLQETNDSVNAIALAIGYQSEGHFFRQFRQHCGMTPLNWRKSQQVG